MYRDPAEQAQHTPARRAAPGKKEEDEQSETNPEALASGLSTFPNRPGSNRHLITWGPVPYYQAEVSSKV